MHNSRLVERVMTFILWLVALLVVTVPLAMAYDLMAHGVSHLSWQFLISEPINAGRQGGIAPMLVSTGLILAICLSVVFPIGLGCALYLSEMVDDKKATGRRVSLALDVLAGVPSIVFGLFGYLFFAQLLGLGFSILSGGLTLACMALPLFIRLSEQAIKYSPSRYRQAAHALNLTHSGFIIRVLLPSSAHGIAAATIVAIGRALAETAVLIFTAGYVTRYPGSVMDSGRALSVHIYDMAMNVAGGTGPAAATSLVLVVILIVINLFSRLLSKRWLPR